MVCGPGDGLTEAIKEQESPCRTIILTRQISPMKDLWAVVQFWLVCLRENPQIVHSHTPKAGLVGMLAAWLARVPIRIHTVAGLPVENAQGWKKKLLTITERITYWAAHEVWPNSQSLKDLITKEGWCPPQKLKVVGKGSSNGIDLSVFSPEVLQPERRYHWIRATGRTEGCFHYLFVGRLVRDKGIVELIEAFASLYETCTHVRLWLAGTFEEVRQEETLPVQTLEQISAHPGIVHLGWVDEVPYLLDLADVLVHPSYREGFPNVLLQAGAMRCPVICSRITGNVDIVKDGETGWLFEKADVATMLDAMRQSLDDRSRAEQMAARLHTEVVTWYERGAFHELLYQEYMRLIAARN